MEDFSKMEEGWVIVEKVKHRHAKASRVRVVTLARVEMTPFSRRFYSLPFLALTSFSLNNILDDRSLKQSVYFTHLRFNRAVRLIICP